MNPPAEAITALRSVDWRWPYNARVAMSVELAFEAFDRQSQYRTQPSSTADLFSLSFADYGWKVGIWRLLALLNEFDLKSHVLVSGRAAELHPRIVERVAAAGHEIAGHGWVNDQLLTTLDRSQELDVVRRTSDAIARVTGARPLGWTSPALMRTAETFDLLRSEGYLWCGDDASEDLPFLEPTPHGELVVIPRGSAFQNDLSVWVTPRGSPEVIWEGFRNTFDVLYAEAKNGLFNKTELTLHCHLAGRPTLVPIIRKCLAYAKNHDGIWFATRREIAQWTLHLLGATTPSA